MTLSIAGVSKTYRRGPESIHALQGISLDISPSEITALVGPSGSGKTTLLNILSGWETPDTGAITWDGRPLGEQRRWNEIAVIPQRLGLLEDLSVRENVELPPVLAGATPGEAELRATELMTGLEIEHLAERLPSDTSLGEQQRTSIARALTLHPRLILADEPTGNQDAARQILIFDALRREAEGGAICIVATHDPDALRHCERVVKLEHGALIEDERRDAGDAQRSVWGRRP